MKRGLEIVLAQPDLITEAEWENSFECKRGLSEARSSSPPRVNASEGETFWASAGLAAASNGANFGAVEEFVALCVARVANFDWFSWFGCSFDKLVVLRVVGQLGSDWSDRLYSPMLQ